MTTVNEYLALLKSSQQEYLVWCIQHYTERKDFHRGLLPFITTHEVSTALRLHLEVLKNRVVGLEIIDNQKIPLVGQRFIRQLLSILETSMLQKLCEEEASTVMFLKSVKLAQTLRRGFGQEVVIRLTDMYGGIPIHEGVIKLKMVGKDKWKVSCSKKLFDRATTWLAESFR